MSTPISRRAFLAGAGSLVVAFALPARGDEPPLPGSLRETPMLDAWIRIGADERVTVFTGKAELGQGIKTALLQLAADGLDVPPDRITLVTADTARTPNEGYTAGSHSMQDSGTAILNAAVQAREILVDLAAARLGAPASALRVDGGVVKASDGRSVSYGALVTGETLHVEARHRTGALPTTRRRMSGQSVPRIDIPAKVTGGVAYVHDLRLPGMLHARVVRTGDVRARLASVDVAVAERMPKVVAVVRDGSFLAVVAEREHEAIEAMRALGRSAKWEAPTSDEHDPFAALLASPHQDIVIRDSPRPMPARALRATYRRPYQMHASIGPSCAVALADAGRLTVWTHTQGVYPLRGALAELLGMPAESIRCIHMEGAGCYGHNGADDVAADAALIATRLPGRPVRVQWMREHEHGWEPYGSPMIATVEAALDANGRISDWHYEVASGPHSTRPGRAGNLAASWLLAKPFAMPPPRPIPQPEGGGDRNAIPLYVFPALRVVHRFVPELPLRVSALRSLGAYHNVFAIESFMDEIALAAKADPIAFRVAHLDDPRARAVIDLASQRFSWSDWRPATMRGRGFAFARYKNLGAYAAVALEIDVDRESGRIGVVRAVAAVDSGEAVNPDGLRNQIEGGIVQSLSWTLDEEVAFAGTRVTSADFNGYPILRFAEAPGSVEVHVVDRPGQPFLGTGEAAQGPTAAALANAFADATGVRIRDLPFRRLRIASKLQAVTGA